LGADVAVREFWVQLVLIEEEEGLCLLRKNDPLRWPLAVWLGEQ
jgi:hypothetical protein